MDGLQSKLNVAPVTRKAWKGLSLIKATKKNQTRLLADILKLQVALFFEAKC